MASCPEVRERILEGLRRVSEPVAGTTSEVKHMIGCADVSNNKFMKALGSLRYHYRLVTWRRRFSDYGEREFTDVTVR